MTVRHDTTTTRQAGFTLLEMLVSLAIMLLVMGAALSALTNAYRANESARAVAGMNNNLRIAMDLVVRDMIQVGQGLPTGRVVLVPSGTGALSINRPHPSTGCASFPYRGGGTNTLNIAAVTPGPGCGPTVNGVATDIVTTIAGDSTLDHLNVSAINTGAHTVTVATGTGGADISTGGPDDVRVGDLMMLTKGSSSTLLYVSAVDGSQTFTANTNDPFRLNQFDTTLTMTGTLNQLYATAPAGITGAQVTRIRMTTYYVETTLDAARPRLVRHLNWGNTAVANNLRGRTVGFDVENLVISYDVLAATDYAGVRLTAEDIAGTGDCGSGCDANQIKKVNLTLAVRSTRPNTVTREFFRNSLETQVSLRSLALKDRYR